MNEEAQEKLKKIRRLMNAPYIIAAVAVVLLVIGFFSDVAEFLFPAFVWLFFGYIPGFICIWIARKKANRLIEDGVQEANTIRRRSRVAILFCALHMALAVWIMMYFGSVG